MDKIFGGTFGLLRGLLIVCVVVWLVNFTPAKDIDEYAKIRKNKISFIGI